LLFSLFKKIDKQFASLLFTKRAERAIRSKKRAKDERANRSFFKTNEGFAQKPEEQMHNPGSNRQDN